jgi:signal transduction histidine kinase
MNSKQYLLKLMLTFLVFAFIKPINAQQSRVDSIIHLLDKSKSKNGLDTTTFESALNLITKTTLSDASINQIEIAGSNFNKGIDEDLSYLIKLIIFNSLGDTNYNRAIEYGKSNIEKLEKSKTPNASTLKNQFLVDLRIPYRLNKLNEGFRYFVEKLNDYKLKNDSVGMSACYYVLHNFYSITGSLDQSIYNIKKSLSYMDSSALNDQLFFSLGKVNNKGRWLNNIAVMGYVYLQKGDYNESVKHFTITFNKVKNETRSRYRNVLIYSAGNIAYAKLLSNQLDSVEYFLNTATNEVMHGPDSLNFSQRLSWLLQIHSFYKIKIGNLDSAETLLKQCWQLIEEKQIPVITRSGTLSPDYYVALIRIKQKRYYDAIELLTKDILRVKSQPLFVLKDYKLLAEVYELAGNNEKAKETYKSFISLKDSVLADESKYRAVSFEVEQQMNEKELSINKLQSDNKISSLTRNFSIGIAGLLLLLAAGVYYRFRSKQKANTVLEKTLSNLKSTQSQLIQSEKMASLGELTAGIAHEIQNPLNFVNNFSDVNAELIDEMENELQSDNKHEALLIAKEIKENEQKINHHGKRADAIVKGMLQHSRAGTGKKEPTDINALADEYLRLSFHGLKAKDKAFEANVKTNFDESIEKIEVVPQDIGRVLLNLYNNAFYAVSEKRKTAGEAYEPTVLVSTIKINDKVEIRVADNGDGISKKVLDKIFQPFFTTKPTGQGTGLGLSMSYDIIKAHGGELKVETEEGEGAEFLILLHGKSSKEV